MTNDQIDHALTAAIEGFDCEVAVVEFTGKGLARADKRIWLLTSIDASGDQVVVMVGNRGIRGPATLKVGTGADVRKFSQAAHFSMKNAGYSIDMIEKRTWSEDSAASLWELFEDHSSSFAAKRAFLQLIGVDVGSTFADMTVPAPKVDDIDNPPRKKAPAGYESNPKWGSL